MATPRVISVEMRVKRLSKFGIITPKNRKNWLGSYPVVVFSSKGLWSLPETASIILSRIIKAAATDAITTNTYTNEFRRFTLYGRLYFDKKSIGLSLVLHP